MTASMAPLNGYLHMNEINGLLDGKAYHNARRNVRLYVPWNHPDLARITRLRFLSDMGYPYWDISYCHGVMKNGEMCDVQLPFNQVRKNAVNTDILVWAKRDGVYAKGLGIYECQSFSQ